MEESWNCVFEFPWEPCVTQVTSVVFAQFVFLIVGQICNNFDKNRAFYDKSLKLGT